MSKALNLRQARRRMRRKAATMEARRRKVEADFLDAIAAEQRRARGMIDDALRHGRALEEAADQHGLH